LDGEFAHGAQIIAASSPPHLLAPHFIVILHNGNLTKKTTVFPAKNAVSHKKNADLEINLKKYLKSLQIYIAKCR